MGIAEGIKMECPAGKVLALEPRGLNRVQAATYVGVSPTLFDEMVQDGRMPQPKRINSRRVWDRRRLDEAFEALPNKDDLNPWDDDTGADIKLSLRYLFQDRDRHGNERLYVRRNGRKIRIKERWGTPAFLDAYRDALAAMELPNVVSMRRGAAAKVGSFRWLVEQYYRSGDFKQLASRTQCVRRGILDGLCERHGDKPCARLEARHIRTLRDEKVGLPGAANSRLRAIRHLFKWACDDTVRLAEGNPARDVPYVKSGSQGFHPWSMEEVRQFEECHPVGTRARLALALLLSTGQRRSDVVRLGRQHTRDGRLVFTPGEE